jgi:hypothetical protein
MLNLQYNWTLGSVIDEIVLNINKENKLNGVYDNTDTMCRERYINGELISIIEYTESMKNNKFFPWVVLMILT